jgi:hypothetical protein
MRQSVSMLLSNQKRPEPAFLIQVTFLHHHHHHHLDVRELGHLLAGSGITHPTVSSADYMFNEK